MHRGLLLLVLALAAIVVLASYNDRGTVISIAAKRKLGRLRRRQRRRAAEAAGPPPILTDLRDAHVKFTATGDWAGLLEMGDMYRKGGYPTHKPDTDMALRIFKACSAAPDHGIAGAAQLKFIECRSGGIRREDIAGADLPGDIGEAAIAHAEKMAGLSRALRKPVFDLQPQPQPQPQPPPTVVTSDAQNVHDHGVARSVATVVDSLPSPGENGFEDVLMHVLDSGASADDKADAVAVLDALTDDDRDVLGRVWAKIQTLENPEDAADILVGQLASGVEHGSVVCASGRTARIVGTLDGLTESSLKPLWAVREELGTLAATVRDAGKSADEFATRASETYAHLSPEVLGRVIDEYKLGFD